MAGKQLPPHPDLEQLKRQAKELQHSAGVALHEAQTRLAREYAHAYVWVTSEKAEQALGYTHRPARETLARAVRWLLENHYVPAPAAERVRLELRPV